MLDNMRSMRIMCLWINMEGKMGTREKFLDKIHRTEAEVQELEARLRERKAYLQAFNDSLKLLPREDVETEEVLKPGSSTSRAVEVLKAAGKPLHINDILVRMGEQPDKRKRTSLVGTLSAYVRKKEILKRTGPNTFALLDWEPAATELPENFGSDAPVAEKKEKRKALF